MGVQEKRTLLYEQHRQLKARMVNFGGWMMPVSYTSVLAEHQSVREHVGIFDVSHMGEVFVSGPDALPFLQRLLSNDVEKLSIGRGQYTVMMNEEGGCVDDLIVYRIADSEYLLCVNASNTEKDFSWMIRQRDEGETVDIKNSSEQWSQLALQGPESSDVLCTLLDSHQADLVKNLGYMGICSIQWQGATFWCARTGYTGERGFEIYVTNPNVEKLWKSILEHGQEHNILPCGLGARDTLRLESCYALYGNELNDGISPIEAGVSWAVKVNKPHFLGKDATQKLKEQGSPRQLHAFIMSESGIPRSGMKIFKSDREVGLVTSGSVLPTVGGSGGMVLCEPGLKVGDEVFVDVRGKRKLAKLMARPLYSARIK